MVMSMKKFLHVKLLALVLLAATVITPLLPAPIAAAADDCAIPGQFTLLPPWYKGLKCDGSTISSPGSQPGGLRGFIIRIALNLIEALFFIVGYIALGMIIWGGFKFMLNGDNQGGQVSARKTILNACIGIVISVFAVVIVNLVGGSFGAGGTP